MKKLKLKCPDCGSILELSIGFTGCDWDTKAGEGSGYNYELALKCSNNDCRRIYPIGYLKKESDFSEVIDNLKCIK